MLSKTSIVMLGMLRSEDLSAYDMLKKIDGMNMRYWFPIGNTTLYETALRLEKKNYIQGMKCDNGKMIYHITESGFQELQNSIRSLFLQIDFDTVWFCLAMMYCQVIPKEELMILIEKRRSLLVEYDGGTVEKIEELKQYNVPFQGICAIERMHHIIQLEEQALEELERNLR